MSICPRRSKILEKGHDRAATYAAIDPNLDFGGGRNLKNYAQLVAGLQEQEDTVKRIELEFEDAMLTMKQTEDALREEDERMKLAAAGHFGPRSAEYKMVAAKKPGSRKKSNPGTQNQTKVVKGS